VNHLLLLFYILTLSLGSGGVVAMAILHYRLRRAVTGAMLFVMSCFLASLFLTLLGYYLRAILLLPPGIAPVRHVVGFALGIAIYAGIFRLLWGLEGSPRFTAVTATALVILVQGVRTGLFLFAPEAVNQAIHLPAIILISLYLLYVGVVLVGAAGPEGDDTVSRLLRRFGVLLVAFAPLSTVLYALIDQIPVAVRPYLSFDFLFFPIWGAIVLSVFVQYIARPSAFIEDGQVSEAFRSAFGITGREAEVIALVSEGLSNQEIADRLHVSLATARTHLYNVFQKTGAGSRVDLLRLASGFRE
jgi:DNA-binding CsgD family transcriptional regulator